MVFIGSSQADLTVFSADAEKALNDILLDKRRPVLFVGEQANYRTLPMALGVARGSLEGVFATYYEQGGKAAQLESVIFAMEQRRDSHPDDSIVNHALEEFVTYLSGLGETWQTLSDHIYAWRADARCLSSFFDEHPDCPKDAAIWFQSPWRRRREGSVSELLRGFIQSASELQSSSGGIVILGTSTNEKYFPKYELDELVLHAEQFGYSRFDCGRSFVQRMYDYGYYHRSGSGMPVHNALHGTMILNAFVKPRKWNASDLVPTVLQIIFRAIYELTPESAGQRMNVWLAPSQVCHSWRETASSMLWAAVLLYMPCFANHFSDINVVHEVLRHSERLPFHLTLRGRNIYGRLDIGREIVSTVIFSDCSTWLYSLTLSGTRRFLQMATSTVVAMSSLKLTSVRMLSLSLTMPAYPGNTEVDIAPGFFQRLPSLEILSLSRISPTGILADLGLDCRSLQELRVTELGCFDNEAELALHTWLVARIKAKRMVKKIYLETRR